MDLKLSTNDRGVLKRIFNANSLDTSPRVQIDLELQPDQHVPTSKVLQLVEIEKQAILLHENGDHTEALHLLNQIISDNPQYASAYNNRAQLLRSTAFESSTALGPRSPRASVAIANPEATSVRDTPSMLLSDLATGIALASPQEPNESVSKMQATVLRSLYSQLASVYIDQAKLPVNKDQSWELRLKASDMLVESCNYGESIAAQLAVAINPYAKLCGNVMELVLSSER